MVTFQKSANVALLADLQLGWEGGARPREGAGSQRAVMLLWLRLGPSLGLGWGRVGLPG